MGADNQKGKTGHARTRSIDILRALTMLFMIFVNDLWTVSDVPNWLGHTEAHEDGMGFSDVIFPLFLFIVGLSIPLAIKNRKAKGDGIGQILPHILSRTMALVVMGFFHVNYGVMDPGSMILGKNLWLILVTAAFFLIWMEYGKVSWISMPLARGLKLGGILLLLFMALVYKGEVAGEAVWMEPGWWGILGLIGWAYLINALIYLFLGRKWQSLLVVLVVFLFLNIQENGYFVQIPTIKIIVSASNHILVLAGVLCTSLLLMLRERDKEQLFFPVAMLIGVIFLMYGFWLRPIFIISKILATPSWTAIGVGIGFLVYASAHLIVDRLGFHKWSRALRPAGTSTLTCYLLPFFIYPIMELCDFEWTGSLAHGVLGLIRSFLFSFGLIVFVGLLERMGIRIKV